jgi:hypothetical protein
VHSEPTIAGTVLLCENARKHPDTLFRDSPDPGMDSRGHKFHFKPLAKVRNAVSEQREHKLHKRIPIGAHTSLITVF